ncbi:hypothetical protein [Methylorubrum suomiense]|uniref:Uncharacterized protein n=1 Tax=Methylorubrum suomiense TaxID=144191 RepID=A0ABQ4V0W1_9HYPH|nr:hypothetical protein [Methylorubrum suomiense]GJE77749.1 hypothetical protein BGCPKDLD_4356 [Methylorubrum suomiense]
MSTDDTQEFRARLNVMERAWVELASHFYFYGLINDTRLAEMRQSLSDQSQNRMEAVFIYSLFHQFDNSPRMKEHLRGVAEVEAFEAKHGKIVP